MLKSPENVKRGKSISFVVKIRTNIDIDVKSTLESTYMFFDFCVFGFAVKNSAPESMGISMGIRR